MLTPDELTTLRADVLATLPDTCAVQRVTLAADGYGGQTETWETIATVACRVVPTGQAPQERVIAERLGNVSVWTLTLPAETDVKVGDRLLTCYGTGGARTFAVAGVLARSEEIARRVICAEEV